MTAPTLTALLPVAPAPTAPASGTRPSSGFATALGDALSGDRGTPEPGTGKAAPDDDTPAAPSGTQAAKAAKAPTAAPTPDAEPVPDDAAPAGPQALDPAAWAFAQAMAAAPVAAAPPPTVPTPGTPGPAPGVGAAGVAPAAVAAPAADALLAGVLPPTPATAEPTDPAAVAAPAAPPAGAVPAGPLPAVAQPPAAAVPAPGTPPAGAALPPGVVVVAAAPADAAPAKAPATAPVGVAPAPADDAPAGTGTTTTAPPVEPAAPGAQTSGQEQAGTGQQGGDGSPPLVNAAAAPPAPAPVTAPAAATAPAPAPPPVATQVAPVVAQLASGPDGTHTMTLVLTPESLGPVEVRVTVHHGTVDLSLRHASEAGRAALLDALPDLRRDLESSGLTCSKLDVGRDSGGSWSSAQQDAQQRAAAAREAADGRGRPWLRGGAPEVARPAPTPHVPSSGLDVRV